jgi:cysteine sulfinate desulfinase/cysteine desulfurase-like protein
MNHVMTDGLVNDTPSSDTKGGTRPAGTPSAEPGSAVAAASAATSPARAYLDAASVAPLHPAAREALLAALDDGWADPRRLHREGSQARLLLDGARESIAAAIGARTPEVGFTGSHVLAVHSAVLGTLRARRRAGTTAVTSVADLQAAVREAETSGRSSVFLLIRTPRGNVPLALDLPKSE